MGDVTMPDTLPTVEHTFFCAYLSTASWAEDRIEPREGIENDRSMIWLTLAKQESFTSHRLSTFGVAGVLVAVEDREGRHLERAEHGQRLGKIVVAIELTVCQAEGAQHRRHRGQRLTAFDGGAQDCRGLGPVRGWGWVCITQGGGHLSAGKRSGQQ